MGKHQQRTQHLSKRRKPRARKPDPLVPADPMFTRLIADLRLLHTHEPADGSDWPEWLEPRSFRRLMQYLLTLECPEREREK